MQSVPNNGLSSFIQEIVFGLYNLYSTKPDQASVKRSVDWYGQALNGTTLDLVLIASLSAFPLACCGALLGYGVFTKYYHDKADGALTITQLDGDELDRLQKQDGSLYGSNEQMLSKTATDDDICSTYDLDSERFEKLRKNNPEEVEAMRQQAAQFKLRVHTGNDLSHEWNKKIV